MKVRDKQQDFRERFARFDSSALINADEYAALLGTTGRGGIYHLMKTAPEMLAQPTVRRARLLRWRVGDVREHMNSLHLIKPRSNRRGGRPRNDGDETAPAHHGADSPNA